MTGIKNLMFDLGGVIMDIERMNAVCALKDLGMSDVDELLGDYGQKGPFLGLERGDIDIDEFHRQLRPYLPAGVTDSQIDSAFIKFLVGIPVERLRALEQLKRKYNIYLLSNTNPLMWNSYILDEFRKDGHDIGYYFDDEVASFQVHAYKPDAEIFHIAEKKFGIKPEETVFFDDSASNCEAAERLGFHTVHVIPGTEFTDYIHD